MTATTDLVHAVHRGGPERMIDLVESRDPHGTQQRVGDVISQQEIDEILSGHTQPPSAAKPVSP